MALQFETSAGGRCDTAVFQAHEARKPSESTQPAGTTQPNARPPAGVQTALYGAEMLSASVVVNYVMNFTVRNDTIWITIFDHQGVTYVGGFNFVQDLPRFMVLLYALQRLDLGSWGRVKELKASEDGKGMEVIVLGKNNNPIKLHLKNPDIARQIALSGRGTEVLDVKSSDLVELDECLASDGIVAKLYWGEEGRDSEGAILNVVDKIAAVNDDVKGHVPMLLLFHKFDVSTSNIRKALGIKNEDAERGSRTLYLLVFRKLRPIWTLLSDPNELYDVWKQCVVCHYGLWKEGVHHRDISATNLMYYRADGKAVGVVNDFDLSTLASSERKFDNERTGTVPFMAIELLEENGQNGTVAHKYRHDVESFIWVFVWVSCQCSTDTGTLREGFLDQLGKVDAIQCAKEKASFLSSFYTPDGVDKKIRAWVSDLFVFLIKKLGHRSLIKANLTRARSWLDMEPTNPGHKGDVAKLEAEFNEREDDMFRCFAIVICLIDVEKKVEQAAKGIPIGLALHVDLE